jgi:predicted translin family RNA/ssDNA-binding protein
MTTKLTEQISKTYNAKTHLNTAISIINKLTRYLKDKEDFIVEVHNNGGYNDYSEALDFIELINKQEKNE